MKEHEKLVVWQKAMDLVVEVYRLCNGLPGHEEFALTGQIRRSVVSIPANIAEGSARRTRKEFLQYPYMARTSLAELETHLGIARRVGYFTSLPGAITSLLTEVGRLLNSFITSLK